MAARLALAKARTVAQKHPESLVIGSDQVAELDGNLLGKPGCFENARAQLRAGSGHPVRFHTGLALLGRGFEKVHVEPFTVHFRELKDAEIDRYLREELKKTAPELAIY